MSNQVNINAIYGASAPMPEVAVQATDTSNLVYNASDRYNIQVATGMPNHNIVFHGPRGKEVGRFDFNDGDCKFEGDASESAKVFTEWCRNQWSDLRAKDKREVLQQVMDDLMQEASGELYSEEEKVAILTCMQRVQARKKEHDAPQIAEKYSQNLAASMRATKEAVAGSLLNALAPEGKSL